LGGKYAILRSENTAKIYFPFGGGLRDAKWCLSEEVVDGKQIIIFTLIK